MAKVAFLGLGVMGYPMAGHLKNKGGHEVTVYNRTAAKAEQWVKQHGGKSVRHPQSRSRRSGLCHGLCRQRQRFARSDIGAETALSPEWARAKSSSITPQRPRKSHASSTRPPRKVALILSMPRFPAVKRALKTAPLP